MARIGDYLMVTDQRGSIGGDVYSRGRSGPTIRKRVKPRNPRSDAQVTVRGQLTNGSRFAKALSSDNVTAWKEYAKSLTFHNGVSGRAYSPSWITALNKLYIPFFLATPGGTFPDTPPTTPYDGDVITFTAAGGSGIITLTGSAQQTSGSTTFVYVEKLLSANRTPSNRPGALLSVIPVPSTPFHVVVSGLAPGDYAVKYKFVKLATGQESGLFSLGTFSVT